MTERPTRDIPGAAVTGRDPLLEPGWSYVTPTNLDAFDTDDWELLAHQRERFRAQTVGTHALRLLASSENDPTFGYQVNNYHHCLQTAALVYRDGGDDDDVVLGLLHDVGLTLCPDSHAEFAAGILAPYLSEKHVWILLHHPQFQAHHLHGYEGRDPREREAFRGHPWFEDCAHWVERYDICSIDPAIEIPPLAFFEPMVRRVFDRAPRASGR
jgi:predicted HD phosphohydrolase